MMTSLPLADCSTMLGIDPKTLRNFLKQARLPLQAHPTDARIKCLTLQQVQQLATLHDRPLQSPVPATLEDRVSTPPSPGRPATPSLESEAAPAQATPPLPTSFRQEVDLIQKLSCLERSVTAMQEHLTQLALAVLQERSERYEQRITHLEACLQQARGCPAPLQVSSTATTSGQLEDQPPGKLRLLPVELQARSRLIPLIEYGTQGRYVIICPREGELSLTPDSPEWFDWLASLSCFRFVGPQGRFTANRQSDRHGPTRYWRAHRCIHSRPYKHYLGTTDHLTIARLEQVAAILQSHLDSL